MAAWEISASLGFVLRGVDLEKRLNSIGKNFRLRPHFDIGKKTPKTLEKVFKEPLGLCSIYRVLEFEPLIVHGICSNLQIEPYILHGICRILERQLQFSKEV